ncbi:MAG: L,D-transpeptidase [Candidatus Shapirobacteria bacterium]|nr:L,D-transpeptidase [Candidatus Shapirobacteria bacterium]
MDYKKNFFWAAPLIAVLAVVNLVPCVMRLFSRQGEINPENIVDEYDPKANEGIFNNKIVEVPQIVPAFESVLGEVTKNESTDKRIEVDLKNQRVYAYEKDKKVHDFLISSGSWDRTPTGTFKIWTKVRVQKMSGGSKELGTYYYLPNVQNVMFFYNEKYERKLGFSFHQAYWHNNFGVPMSHGCINMTTNDSATLYKWAEIGTPVVIYGKYQTVLPRV